MSQWDSTSSNLLEFHGTDFTANLWIIAKVGIIYLLLLASPFLNDAKANDLPSSLVFFQITDEKGKTLSPTSTDILLRTGPLLAYTETKLHFDLSLIPTKLIHVNVTLPNQIWLESIQARTIDSELPIHIEQISSAKTTEMAFQAFVNDTPTDEPLTITIGFAQPLKIRHGQSAILAGIENSSASPSNVQLTAELDPGLPIETVSSSTHQLRVIPDSRGAMFVSPTAKTADNKPVDLKWTIDTGAAPRVTMAHQLAYDLDHILLAIHPPSEHTTNPQKTPILSNIAVHWPEGIEVEAFPERFSDLTMETPVYLLARLSRSLGVKDRIEITGHMNGRFWRSFISSPSVMPGIAKYWALSKLTHLQSARSETVLPVLAPDSEALELALQYGLSRTHFEPIKLPTPSFMSMKVANLEKSSIAPSPNWAMVTQTRATLSTPMSITAIGVILALIGLLILWIRHGSFK